jgi:prephenate dehydratase
VSRGYRHPHLSRIERAIDALTAERARLIDAPPRVAYQGAPGAFSEEAARLFFPGATVFVPMRTLADVFGAMARQDVEFAVVPVENTLAGAVPGCLQGIRESRAQIIGERVLRIAQAAIGVPGATLAAARIVRSHPVALAQCRQFLEALPHIAAEDAFDTAGAVADIMRVGDPHVIAIGSALAARHYGADVLQAEVQDVAANFTRFVLLGQERGWVLSC